MRKSLLVIWQQLQMQMLQSMLLGLAGSAIQSMDDMINCSRCANPTPESELLEIHAWWVCGICYDDL
jgi:hypothetical protein